MKEKTTSAQSKVSKQKAAVPTKEPMLYDGLGPAIANIRKRKNRLQLDCIAHVKGDQDAKLAAVKKWSRMESGIHKIFGPEEEKLLLKGLGCTKIELWEEKMRVERDYYRKHAAEVGEPKPGYDTSALARHVEQLFRLDADELPPNAQQEFHELRNIVVTLVTQISHLIERVGGSYRAYRDVASSS